MAVATTAVVTQFTIDSITKPMASGKQPLCSLVSFEWGGYIPLGTLSQDVTINLPAIPSSSDGYIGDILITAYQSTGNSYTITIVAPTGKTVSDGTDEATDIVFSLSGDHNIEISCLPVSTGQISILSKEAEQE